MQGRTEDVSASQPNVGSVLLAGEAGRASARRQYRRLYRVVALTDVVSVVAALILARLWFNARPLTDDVIVLAVTTPLAIVVVYSLFHLYDAYRFTPAEEFRRIILAVSVGLTGLVTLAFWSNTDFSRGWLALSWALAVVFALGTRRLWHRYIGHARTQGRLSFSTILVGSNAEAEHLASVMQRPGFGFRAAGVVTTAAADRKETGLPVLGDVSELRDLIRETHAECIFVASSAMSPEEMSHVAKAVRLEGVEVRVTATLPQVLSSRLSVQPIGGLTALSLRPVQLSGTQAVAKRLFDLLLSGIGLVLMSPVLMIIAMSVKLSSAGPVLYRQTRVGRRGKPFTMLKFRTMQTGSDARVDELRAKHGMNDLMFKMRDDPRVTRTGRILRRFSLDELPQLINVLKGDMSLVGPRPPLPEEVTKYEDWQFDRLEVPPGITGLWQVSGRSELSFDDCVRLDLFYVENWSLAYDLYILAKTLPVLVFRRGAF
jgi:exopolysaccharide biosynthesis polyprenyl glycosylphosphotransferase